MAIQEIRIPDLGGGKDLAVVDILVSAGDTVEEESPLISLESDKAVMEIPSPLRGTIKEIKVSEGDKVNTGDLIAIADSTDSPATSSPAAPSDKEPSKPTDSPAPEPKQEKTAAAAPAAASGTPGPINAQAMGQKYHATPSVRSFARELGVDLSQVTGTGPKGRITRTDLSGFVKASMSGGSGSFGLPPIPTDDFAAYGPVEMVPLSRIKKISGPHLHRNWVGIPHVTQFEDADITDLEAFRKSLNEESLKTGEPKVSPLVFIIKAVVQSLKAFPDFNSSLNPDGNSITRKLYYNIGIAVDTPGGLVVPVVKDADTKGIRTLVEELADLSGRARANKLKPDEMKGGTFTISSLGGIGGTAFTPIVNAPELGILGLSRSVMKPVWNGKEFVPRLMLPLSLSYDHRVIDGAQGARFAVHLASVIGDIRRALL